MIRFKDYAQLDEARRVSAVTKAILGQKFKSYEKWLNRFATMPFPLSRTMLKRLQVGEKDVRALHSTDEDGLKTLIDIQGTAKQISAFTELQDIEAGKVTVEGIATGGGFIAEVVGDVAFKGSFDIFTGSDRQGRRWLDLKQFTFNKEIQASNPDFFTDYERGYLKIIRDHTEKILYNNSIRKFFEDVEYYILPPAKIIQDFDQTLVFWVGSQGKKIINKTDAEAREDKGIIHNLQAALRNTLSRKASTTPAPVWKRILKEHKNVEKKLKRTIFQITKDLFDFAEEYFTENWIEFSMLGGDPRKTSASYNEVVMDSITIKKIYVDADSVIYDSSTKNFGSKSKPYLDDVKEIVGSIKLKVMQSSDWSNLFRKWVRR
tara:strand:+ start:8537 stop:9664 length:1128 start_codon:yes stop_codon:yes gene_type:complete